MGGNINKLIDLSQILSLNHKPHLNLVMNVEVEQVEVTKLLVVTLDCEQSWSKHIDTTAATMG